MLATTSVRAQSVAAAGQPPANPGRFGFSLECVFGCSWVESGTEPSYFRHKGEPRVSDLAKNGPAARAGLRVGDVIVQVDSEPVTSIPAGLRLASDTVERLVLLVRNEKGRTRTVSVWSPRRCDGGRSVIVGNHSGEDVTVYMYTRRRTRTLARVGQGQHDITIPGNDSTFRTDGFAYFSARPTSGRRNLSNDWRQLVVFRMVCHE